MNGDYRILYRVGVVEEGSICAHFFFQGSQPYKYKDGRPEAYKVSSDLECDVLTLGGKFVLYCGHVGDIPDKEVSYLTEVRVWITSNGKGIEENVQKIDKPFNPFSLPRPG